MWERFLREAEEYLEKSLPGQLVYIQTKQQKEYHKTNSNNSISFDYLIII